MARNLGQLTLDLVARIGGFTTPLDRARQQSKKTTDSISRDFEGMSKRVGAAALRFAGPLAAAFSAHRVGQMATAYTELQNRLRLVTASTGQLAQATNAVFDISMRTAQSTDAAGTVFQRFAQNADRLGLSLGDVADLTDTVAKAVAISGASASSSQAALVQFGQALASGVLRGEELNSVMEQTPALAMAIADGLGIGIGKLRALAEEGKITADEVVRALRNAAQGVNESFSTRVLTIPQAFQNFETALTRVIGTVDSASGVSSSLARALDGVAQSINNIDTGSLVRDIDSIKSSFGAVYDLLNDAGDQIGGDGALGGLVRMFSDTIPDSLSEFVRSSVKEMDFLIRSFQSFYGGMQGAAEYFVANMQAFFGNMFDGIIILADGWVNDMIARVNAVARAFNLPELATVAFAEDRRTDRPFYSLTDSWAAGAKRMSGGDGLLQEYDKRMGDAAILRSITEWEREYTEETKKNTKATDDNTKAKKGKTSAGQTLIQNMREQVALMGKITELEKLQTKIDIGAIKFDSERQKQDALGFAATLDFLNEYTEKNKEIEEWRQKFSKVTESTTSDMGEFAKEAARNIQQSLGDGLYGLLTGSFDNIGMAFAQMLARMAADAASAQIAKALFGDYDKDGGIGGLLGAGLGALTNYFNPISAGSSFVGGGTALGSLNGLSFMPGFASGGFTGSGGRNSIAGVVHGNEYVFNADATQRLGVNFLDNLASGRAIQGASPIVVENHGVDLSVQRDAENRVRAIARPVAFDVLAAEGPGMVAREVGTPNRPGWKAVNQSFKTTPRRN